MRKKSYIDYQTIVKQYKVGDSVLFPIETRGNSYAPYYGRITAVMVGIGMLDVETAKGNIRVPAEDVLKDTRDTSHMKDTSTITYDRAKGKQASRVSTAYSNKRLLPLFKQAQRLASTGASELSVYNKMFMGSQTFSDHEIRLSVEHAFGKEALYWKEVGRKYTPSKSEQDSGKYSCPHCKVPMKATVYKKRTKLYACPICLWLIKPSDLAVPSCGKETDTDDFCDDAVDQQSEEVTDF